MAVIEADPTGVAELREQAFRGLEAAMPAANMDAARRCSVRLLAALPHQDRLESNLVMVAYGGGKDSSYTLAFVRTMQLMLLRAHGSTFRLRVATNRHAGMPRAVMENIDREYQALRLPADPACELLLIDGDEVSVFDVDSPQRELVVNRNRLDILMTGHRTFADGRPTFCNACNLSVVNAFGIAASYGDGADLIITGDSQQEQRQYTLWVGRLARRLNPDRAPTGKGLGRLLATVDGIAQGYFADIHGSESVEAIAERRVSHDVPEELRFFSIYDDTEYASGDHMELLTGFLGFQFDDIAFSFTESDCGNPALMVHLRGLKCERVYQRPYAEGMQEYVDFALGLMRSKDFPPQLVEQMQARYAGPDATAQMRRAAEEYAWQTFGLTEEQLVCMVYSPFADMGAGLPQFLTREHPALAGQIEAVLALLAEDLQQGPRLAAELERISGLTLAQLRVLYRSSLRGSTRGAADAIDAVLVGDPHKAVIRTRFSENGPETVEQISGR
ncbi:MAG: PqqD family protein [Jatrophihabitantaceae bacterium]